MSKPPVRIRLTKSGVFLEADSSKRKIAEPLSFHAIGKRQDGARVAEIRFKNHVGEKVSEYFDLQAINPRNRHKIADGLTSKGYIWPVDGPPPEQIVRLLVSKVPDRQFMFVTAPGWHDGGMLTSIGQYGGRTRLVIDPNSGAHLAIYRKGKGSLKGWQKSVAQLAKKSSPLRLSIADAFAAPLLRLLGMDSFALNLFGPTSDGKSTCLHVAASVCGLIDEESGLPKWADSNSAIEQLAIGHRDGLVPLDESGDEADPAVALAKRAQMLAFLFSRNRARTLDKSYQKRINLTVRDFRATFLSSSEFSLKEIAERAGTKRQGGEEVRFVDVPATAPGSIGIFDALDVPAGRNPRETTQKLVDNLRRDAQIHQGFAMDAYLKRLTVNLDATVKRAKRHMEVFQKADFPVLKTGPDLRICANFALIYAGAALAIDYKILPWGKRSTRSAIAKCMNAAFATLREPPAPQVTVTPLIDEIARTLISKLDTLNLITVQKGKRCSDKEAAERKSADGFRIGNQILVKSKSWKGIHSGNRAILVEHEVLAKQRGDTVTIERKIFGVSGKPRYHVVNDDKLQSILAGTGAG